MKTARLTNTVHAFIIEIGSRRVYAAEGPFKPEECARLGKYMWDVLKAEGVTHLSENGEPAEFIADQL